MKITHITILILLLALSACTTRQEGSNPSAGADSIQAFVLKKQTVSKTISLPAELLPWERAEVYAKVEGYVGDLRVDIGDQVRKNDVLAVLDAPEVTANYYNSLSDFQAAQSRYRTSEDTFRRMLQASGERGTVAEIELEKARNQMLADSASLQSAKYRADAQAQLRNYLVIRAPYDGTITQRNIDPGTLVGKSRSPMFMVEDVRTLRLRLYVPEAYTNTISSSSIVFTVDAQPSKQYTAQSPRKSNQIDPKTRTELWEFKINNTGNELKSGMYGEASLSLQRTEPSFLIPQSALVTTLEKRFVIRVEADQLKWIDVRSGISLQDKVEIFGDLTEGDQLILRANDEIKEGKLAAVLKLNGR